MVDGASDWTDPQHYPSEITLREFGWEFLRRRPDYRAMWKAWSQGAEDGPYRHAVTDDPLTLRVRFGLSVLIDPVERLADFVLFQLFCPPYGYGVNYQSMETAEHAKKAGKMNIAFDIGRPLAPQLEQAKRFLTSIQAELGPPPVPRDRFDRWPLFLRALDARETGATYQTMADVFWPGYQKQPQSARDLYHAARRVRDRAPFFM